MVFSETHTKHNPSSKNIGFNQIIIQKNNKNSTISHLCLSSFFQLLTAICGGGKNERSDCTNWIVSIKAGKKEPIYKWQNYGLLIYKLSR